MSYDDRLIEEAWAIARSKKAYESDGIKWEPWMFNVVTVYIADILSGKKPNLDINVPDEEDYKYARERVDSRIEDSRYSYERIKRARLVYIPTHLEEYYMHPWDTELNASWNGMRDPLSVDEFFHLAGIPEEESKTVFRFDPDNVPKSQRVWGGYFGFAFGGKQRLADLVEKPIAFVQIRNTGRKWGTWDLSSKQLYTPR